MGLIQKQSISGTIYSYVGVVLGFVATAILYPRIFSTEEVGLLRILVSYSVLFSQFAGLGINTITVRLFPYFRDYERKHHGYLGLALLVSMIGLIISVSAFILLKTLILGGDKEGADLLTKYYYYIVPLIVFTLLFNVFDTYYRVLYNAVKGIIYKEVVQRTLILLVVILFYFETIDFHNAVILYTIALISPTILLFLSLIYNKQLFLTPNINFIDKKLSREMMSVGVFGVIASFSGVLVLNIDVIMVERMLGLSDAGIYSITFFFGTLILVPMRTMGKISSVVIADAWKINDLNLINQIYKKSSISLSIVGLLLFIGIWGNIDNVFHIIPSEYLPGKYVILIIGIANLIDIALGVSPHIIVNSKHYRYLSYFLIIFTALIIISNLLLIPIYGIVGAAIATLISKFIYSLINYIFLYRAYRLQPFTSKTIILYIIGAFAYGASLLLPEQTNYIVDIFIRSSFILVIFSLPVYFLNVSEDINQKADAVLKSLFKVR
ncbi:MAG: oligosaccharide flippase family protein [Bacteroidetes bacterium]|nr:oligosaccharide flippase family protein [Bacteroidota bacterium]MBL6944429.1 oligosaccharide flippase family protein [Bacteroidales bacterium]